MKLLFVHDVKASIYNGKVYARSYGYSVWKERYLNVFDEVRVVTRSKIVKKNPEGFIDLLSGENVEYDNRIGMFKGPDVFFSKKIRNVIRENVLKSDFVICRLDSFLGLIAIRECKKLKKPYLIEVVGCAWDSFWNHGLSGKIIAPFMFMLMKMAIKNSKYVVYVTESFLQKRYPTNGVHTNISNVKIQTPDNVDELLERRIKKIREIDLKGQVIIGTAANIDVRYKGQQYVIRALGMLKKKGYANFVYQLPGAGDSTFLLNEAKRNGVEQNVLFLGSLTHEKMMEWYKSLDLYIQPSLQEGLPRAVIEAMNFGIPCMGTNIAGIPELIPADFLIDKKKMALNICDKLINLKIENLADVASRNVQIAQRYEFSCLNRKREKFFKRAVKEQLG